MNEAVFNTHTFHEETTERQTDRKIIFSEQIMINVTTDVNEEVASPILGSFLMYRESDSAPSCNV